MKTIARIQLEPGMELAEDIYDYKNNLLYAAGTYVDEQCIAKLARYSIMAVTVKDIVDYATTHYEKVRYSDQFDRFEKEYRTQLIIYKTYLDKLFNQRIFPTSTDLLNCYNAVRNHAKDDQLLLDYLYSMLPSKDDLTYAHCFNSALIAGVFANWLGLNDEDKKLLILSGFYYDIGKLRLPYELIWKPGKLTELEFTQMKTHTFIGFQIIQNTNVNEHVVRATLMHHERIDGSGYPSHLRGDQIDPFARYVAIVDSYEAMTSARSYRKPMNPFQVIETFEKSGAFQYDTNALNAILFRIASGQVGLTAKLSNDMEGEIVLINQRSLSRPLIKCGDQLYDLASNPTVSVVSII